MDGESPSELSLTLAELQERIDISPRTLGKYIAAGLVPPPVGRGPAARYERVHLVRLLAIARMQEEGVRRLDQLLVRLDAMTPDELEDFALEEPTETEGDGPHAPGSEPDG